MKRRVLLLLSLLVPGTAFAQSPPPPVPVPVELVNRIYAYLSAGGTYLEAAGLRDAIAQAVQAPQREAETQRRIDDAVAKAKAKEDK